MFAPSKKTRLLSLVLFLPAAVLAAPHADPKLVDLWSRMDEFHAARGVQRAVAPRALKRAAPDAGLEQLLDRFLDAQPNTGLLVLKGDTILAERYQYGRTAGHRLASASVAKTVLGMLVGIAVHEKKISSLDDRASKYLPSLQGHAYGDATIRDLLTMSSGIGSGDSAAPARDDGVRLIGNTLLERTLGGIDSIREFEWREAVAGTRFRYNSADSQVLGLVLQAAVRETLASYLSEKIWKPMGAEAHATWLLDKSG